MERMKYHHRHLFLLTTVYCLAAGSLSAAGVDVSTGPLFAVYSGRASRPNHYIPSGYMGDINNLVMSGGYIPTHDGTGTPLRVVYRPKGAKGWSGIYWQHPANNWGERAGQSGFDLRGATRLVFWARGEKGGEKIHEVRMGGISGRFPDSDVATQGPIILGNSWQRYEIDLNGKDLRHIIGGFGIFLNKYDNPGDVKIYLDDIAFEMPQTAVLPAVPSTVSESTPVTKGITPSTATVPAHSSDIQVKSEADGLRVSFSSQFLFSVGQTVLRPESERVLKQIVDILKAYPKNDVLVEGHTDNRGNAAYNLTLSKLRAEHVQDYLVKQGGFEAKRFRVVGYGQTQPIADNATRTGRAQNRRVEVMILKTGEKQ